MMGFLGDLVRGIGGVAGAVGGFLSGNPALIAAGIGGIGSLLSGGGDQEQNQTLIRQLSPEQRALLAQLQGELGASPFDTAGIAGAARERIGNESSALRIAAMQRLQRGGVGALQQQSALADITTRGFRELGSTIANIQFAGQQADVARRQDIFRQMSGVLSGTGGTTQNTTATGPSGVGFAQLFGAGLQGLLQPTGTGNGTGTGTTSPRGTGQTFNQFFRRGLPFGG